MRRKHWIRCWAGEVIRCMGHQIGIWVIIIMERVCKVVVLCMVVAVAQGLRLFMIGGHAFQDAALFNDLAAAVDNREPTPGSCDPDWAVTKCPRVAVITSSHQTEAQGNQVYNEDDEEGQSYQHIFLKFGMAPQHISVHADNYQQTANPATDRGRKNLQILSFADILFFAGGDQSKHVRSWLNDDGSQNALLAMIKNRAMNDEIIVSGSSAGSMIYDTNTYGYGSPYGVIYFANAYGLAPKTIPDAAVNGTNLSDMRNGTDCVQYEDNAGKMPGFNWFDVVFDTHFHIRGRIGRITAVMSDLKRSIGVGLDENTSFFYENGQGKVFGEHGVTIFDATDALKIPSKYFQMQNVKVHYLTEGDRYDFKNKVVTSSKPLITTPRFKNSTDSDDIFGEYQGSLLLTRLVDQTATFNRGRSVIPEGYPAEAPIFELTFSKNAGTKGYRRGEAYTVVNAIVEYSYITGTESSLRTE